jgi:hypothetical protein
LLSSALLKFDSLRNLKFDPYLKIWLKLFSSLLMILTSVGIFFLILTDLKSLLPWPWQISWRLKPLRIPYWN